MLVTEMIDAVMNEVKEKLQIFCGEAVEEELTPDSAERVARGIQEALMAGGRAGYKTYLESKEETRDIIAADGEAYRFKQFSVKRFVSLFGHMEMKRKLFQNASDTRTFFPLDEAWGMAEEFMTVEVREAAAFASAHMTPEEAAKLFEKSATFQPHPTQIKRALQRIDALVTPEREALDESIREQEEVPEETRVLVVSMDGANVRLGEAGKKTGRPAERPTPGADKEPASTYRNAMVGSVTLYGAVPEDGSCPQRIASRYTSHMPEERAATFKEKFEAEVSHAIAAVTDDVVKVLLCDGARPLWKYAEGNPLFEDFRMLIDYCHAAEHLSLASEALFGKDSEEAKLWYKKYASKLKEDEHGVRKLLQSMDYYAKTLKLSAARQRALATQRTFFRRNQAKMNYADFRKEGLPIGSGPIEAACKTIVKARLCRSGMRWKREGGQRILDLRTYVKSKRWDAFWARYKELKCAA